MPNQTEDIEIAIEIILKPAPMTLDELMAELLRSYPQLNGQQQWIGVAMSHLGHADKIRYPACSPEHWHDGPCRVEWVAS